MISKEIIKEATIHRKMCFWIGLITLPVGIGLLFLIQWVTLKIAMDDYIRVLANDR